MAEPLPCPSCYSLNKPGATRCRVCAARLREPARSTSPAKPVLLERVMSGEVFTAIIGRDIRRADHEPAKDPGGSAREAEELEAYRRTLRELEAALRTKAITSGKRFERYEPPRRRRRRKARSEVALRDAIAPAMEAMRARRFGDAVDLLRRAVEDDDEDPRIWILLGEASLRTGEAFDAASAFARALDLNPQEARGWLGLARTLREAGELPAALASLDRSMAVHPDSAEAWAERGFVLEALENLPEALRSLAKAIELRPDFELARARHAAIERQLHEAVEAREPGPPPTREPEAESRDAEPSGAEAALLELEASARDPEPAPPENDLDLDGIEPEPSPAPTAPDTPVAPSDTPLEPSAEGIGGVPAEAAAPADRVRTYVDGLDEALDGGIPAGHVVLLEGAPGTMKSSLGFSILLHNAAREGRHGVYVTLEERADRLLRQMTSLGLPLPADRGSLVLLDPRTAKDLLAERADWVAAFRQALEVLAKFSDRRREMYRLFEWLRDLRVTAFIVAERPDWVVGGHVLQGRWDEDFLADGVIQLRLHHVSDLDIQRRIRIVKMRGTKHEPGYFALVLDEGRLRVARAIAP